MNSTFQTRVTERVTERRHQEILSAFFVLTQQTPLPSLRLSVILLAAEEELVDKFYESEAVHACSCSTCHLAFVVLGEYD